VNHHTNLFWACYQALPVQALADKAVALLKQNPRIRLCISRRLVIIGRPELEVTIHYIRYWQILEALAESRNYNPDMPLVDYTGGAMTAP
jgi:hypothetical protein